MGGVHVAHLEAGALAGQAARPQRRNPAFVGHFGQGIVLVHELRQLGRTEKFLGGGRHGLGVDQVLRSQPLGFGQAQAFLDRALDPHQADTEHVLGHFADAADPAIAEMVDVVHHAVAVANIDQHLEYGQNVFHRQHAGRVILGGHAGQRRPAMADSAVELHATHIRQIVAFRREEQVVQQTLGGVLGRRFAGAHHPVDFHLGLPLTARGIRAQGIGEVGTPVDVVDVQRLEFADAGDLDFLQLLQGQLVVGLRQQLAGPRVAQVARQDFADQILAGNPQALYLGLGQFADVLGLHPLARFQQLPVADEDVEAGGFALQALGHQIQGKVFAVGPDGVGLEKDVENPLVDRAGVGIVGIGFVEQRPQQNGDRQLAAAVDAGVHDVLDVEFEIQPGATIGDDPRRKQQLARRVGLALVVIEKHAGGAMQLRNDDPLGAVDDEGAVIGHQRQLTHVNFVFLDILDLVGAGLGILVHQHQPQPHPQRSGVGQSTQLTFADVEHRLAQPVTHVLQPGVARITDDREHRAESGVQSHVPAFSRRYLGLQKLTIRIQLDRQQVGHLEDAGTPAEIFTNASLFSKSIGHRDSSHESTSQGRKPPDSIAGSGPLSRESERRFSPTDSNGNRPATPGRQPFPFSVRPSQIRCCATGAHE